MALRSSLAIKLLKYQPEAAKENKMRIVRESSRFSGPYLMVTIDKLSYTVGYKGGVAPSDGRKGEVNPEHIEQILANDEVKDFIEYGKTLWPYSK